MPEPDTVFASKSVPRHLARGSVGFGLLFGGVALASVIGPVALIASPLGLVALRGCPACWMLGLAETISQGRVRRQCADGILLAGQGHLVTSPEITMMGHLLRGEIPQFMATSEAVGEEHAAGIDAIFAAAVARSAAPADRLERGARA